MFNFFQFLIFAFIFSSTTSLNCFAFNFNNFRSPTKFFDTTRLGAVGLYSNLEPFANFIKNNDDGILLENNIKNWVEKISYLLENSDERRRIFENALRRYEDSIR